MLKIHQEIIKILVINLIKIIKIIMSIDNHNLLIINHKKNNKIINKLKIIIQTNKES